jgi:hypothetical protein
VGLFGVCLAPPASQGQLIALYLHILFLLGQYLPQVIVLVNCRMEVGWPLSVGYSPMVRTTLFSGRVLLDDSLSP